MVLFSVLTLFTVNFPSDFLKKGTKKTSTKLFASKRYLYVTLYILQNVPNNLILRLHKTYLQFVETVEKLLR